MPWDQPTDDTFRPLDPAFFHDSGETEFQNLQELEAAYGMEDRKDATTFDLDSEKKESLAAKFKDHKDFSSSLKKMLELLCNEAGFLVNSK